MTNQAYKKVGRRYVPVGYSDGWSGFPTDGIWVVQTTHGRKSSECMLKINEVESMRPTIDMLIGYKDDIVKYLMNNTLEGISPSDYVSNMIKEITANTKEE